jgi:hypothetical protein
VQQQQVDDCIIIRARATTRRSDYCQYFSTIFWTKMRREINPRIKSFALIVTVVSLAWVSKYGFGSGISVAIKTIR